MEIARPLLLLFLIALTSCEPAPAPSKPTTAPTTAPAASPWNLDGPTPHVVAHYMPWFEVTDETDPARRTWTHWRWDGAGPKHDPENLRADGTPDIASVITPLIGPYNSRDRDVMRYHLNTAKSAGIQAFVVIWYGPGSDTDRRLPALLDEALASGMKIAICYEEKTNFPPYRAPKSRDDLVETVRADLQYVIDRYADHPAYLRRNDLPMIAQFNFWGEGALGANTIQPTEWERIYAKLSKRITYCRQNLDWDQHPPIQGAYVWWTPDEEWLTRFPKEASRLRGSKRLDYFMTMICPGFDDTGVHGWGAGPRVTPRNGLDVLQRTMRHATTRDPELIQIVTWNDFAEGTAIEPTREYGFAYLDAIEQWIETLRHRPCDLPDNRTALAQFEQARAAKP